MNYMRIINKLIIKIIDWLFTKIHYLKDIRVKIQNNNYSAIIDELKYKRFEIVSTKYDQKWNKYTTVLINQTNQKHLNFIIILWNTLITIDEWNNIDRKILMITFYSPKFDSKFYIHKNIVITKDTTVVEYYNKVKDILQHYWDEGSIENSEYYIFIIVEFLPINIVGKKGVYKKLKQQYLNNPQVPSNRTYSTNAVQENKNNDRWLIKPIKLSRKSVNTILCTLDIESIKFNNNNSQIPIAISFSYLKNDKFNSFITLIDPNLLKINYEEAILDLWTNFYDKLKKLDLGKKYFCQDFIEKIIRLRTELCYSRIKNIFSLW